MFGRVRRLNVVLAVVSAVLIVSGAAAQAADPGAGTGGPVGTGDPHEWTVTADCATGALTGAARDFNSGRIVVFGWASLCEAPPSGSQRAEFGLVNFDPEDHVAMGSLYPNNLRQYSDDPAAPRAFGAVAVDRRQFATCLMSTYRDRISCAEITVSEDGAVSFREIPVDHPIVNRPVRPLNVSDPEPECGSCF